MTRATINLDKALAAWGTPVFDNVLKQEIERLDAALLPLQQGLSQGNHVADSGFSAMLISVSEQPGEIHARAGILYSGLIAGCGCADDPTPLDERAEYCVLHFIINKDDAATTVSLLPNE